MEFIYLLNELIINCIKLHGEIQIINRLRSGQFDKVFIKYLTMLLLSFCVDSSRPRRHYGDILNEVVYLIELL